jgi:hypothetical protein
MKIATIVIGIILITISCATVPTGPLAPGELRLTSLEIPEMIQAGTPFDMIVSFQTNEPVQFIRACFYSSGGGVNREGPFCDRVVEIVGTKTFKVRHLTRNPNVYTLIGYVEYRTGGQTKISNEVSAIESVR